jgi:hypothetical protein
LHPLESAAFARRTPISALGSLVLAELFVPRPAAI